MTLRYTLTEQDVINFHVYHLCSTRKQGVWRVVNGIAIFAMAMLSISFLVFLYAILTAEEEIPAGTIIDIIVTHIFPAATLYLCVFSKLIIKAISKRSVKKAKNNDAGEKLLTLDDEGIMEETDAHTTSGSKYSTIEKICFVNDCFYIYNGTNRAYLVPLSAFADDGQKQEFLNIIQRKTTGRTVPFVIK